MTSYRYVLAVVSIAMAGLALFLLGVGPLTAFGFGGLGVFVIFALLWPATSTCIFLAAFHRWGTGQVSAATAQFLWRGLLHVGRLTFVVSLLGIAIGFDRVQSGRSSTPLIENVVLQRISCSRMSSTGVRVTVNRPESKNGKWCFSPQGSLQSGLRDTVRLHPDQLGSVVPLGGTVEAQLFWYPSVLFGQYGYFSVDTK